MASSDHFARQWGVLRALQAHRDGLTVLQLSRRFEVSKNTIVRDFDTLIAAGVAVHQEVDRNRHLYRLADGMLRLPELQFTVMELLAIYAARAQLTNLAGTPLFDDLAAAIHKIQGLLRHGVNGVLEALPAVFSAQLRGMKDYSGRQEVIDDLVDAMLRRRRCRVTYRNPHALAPRVHELLPLRLVFHLGGLYCLGLLGPRRHVTTLAVERIESLTKTRRPFKIPRGLRLDDRLAGPFGILDDGDTSGVEVVFSAAAAPYIRARTWHPTQAIEELAGGRIRWTATVQGKEELLMWVLGRAADAELVRPASWRKELLARARVATRAHRQRRDPAGR